MHGIPRQILVRLPSVAGIDLSITNEVVLLWVAALVTFILLAPACRRGNVVPRGPFQNVFEALVQFVERQIVRDSIGAGGARWSPFLLTLFFFILVGNLFGLVPLPQHFKSITASLGVTAALALIVFGVTVGINVTRHGPAGFAAKFMPSGVPVWIAVVMVPIEVISWLARPVSLAIRLFANMLVGHTLIFIFIGMEMAAVWFLLPLPLAGAVIMSCFEIFVAFVQAFVFTLLAGIYIKEALAEH